MIQNLIVGDSLDLIANGRFTQYHGEVKCIYIDPPYNTLTKKSYNDKVEQDEWETMMTAVISESKKLLTKDGVLFISIDDAEYATTKILCDGVFGKENFVGTFITFQSQRSNSKLINTVHEYVICYAKEKKSTKPFKVSRLDIPEQREWILKLCDDVKKASAGAREKLLKLEIKRICERDGITWLKNYSSIDEQGNIFFGKDLSVPSAPRALDIPEIGLHLEPLATRGWSSKEKFLKLHAENRLAYKAGRPYEKHLLTESEDNAPSVLNFYSRQGTKDLERLGLKDAFDTPKPLDLIKYLIRLVCKKGDLVVDFFGGSGTTAVAAHELGCQWMIVQREEEIDKSTKQYEVVSSLGIKPVISEITKERLSRAIGNDNFSVS